MTTSKPPSDGHHLEIEVTAEDTIALRRLRHVPAPGALRRLLEHGLTPPFPVAPRREIRVNRSVFEL